MPSVRQLKPERNPGGADPRELDNPPAAFGNYSLLRVNNLT
jgi:hypothetical protein